MMRKSCLNHKIHFLLYHAEKVKQPVKSFLIISILKKKAMPTQEQIIQFKQSLRGKLIQPHDEDYNTSRKVYNGMINKHPALIAKCANVADVISSVNFARENK